jgi:hypothetical protein
VSDSKLKDIGGFAFLGSGLKSIEIPSTVEVIGKECFSWCTSLCEVRFHGKVGIEENAFLGCPLKCVRVPVGVKLDYNFGSECKIVEDEIPNPTEGNTSDAQIKMEKDSERVERYISDTILDLESDYERIERIGERVEVYRHRITGECVVVKSFQIVKGTESKVQEGFMREVESLIRLDHFCILSLKGCCLSRGEEGPKLVTEFLEGGSLKSVLADPSKVSAWWTNTRKAMPMAPPMRRRRGGSGAWGGMGGYAAPSPWVHVGRGQFMYNPAGYSNYSASPYYGPVRPY